MANDDVYDLEYTGRMFRFNHGWAMARGEQGLRQIVAQSS